MRRFAKYLILTVGMAACDSATEAVGPASAEQRSALAAAVPLIDLSIPGTGTASWRGSVERLEGGRFCHTQVSFPSVNEPLLDLTCGTVYRIGTDVPRYPLVERREQARETFIHSHCGCKLESLAPGRTADG